MTTTKRNSIIGIGCLLIIFIIGAVVNKEVSAEKSFKVTYGEFESYVITKGQMKSQEYTKVNLPDVMCNPELGIYQIKINHLVPEGTSVKRGEYVGLLDQESIKSELNKAKDRIMSYKNNLNMSKIDSTSELTDYRNTIMEMEFDLEYKKITIKQSIYESRSYQEKVKREYGREERKLEITKRNYKMAILRHEKRCKKRETDLNKMEKRLAHLQEAMIASRITAPQDGIVIYATTHGRKISEGDRVSFWSPEIAVMPNINKLVSETYIEEVDLEKVKIGSSVRVKVDALPEKEFTGKIVNFSNIGKSMKGLDSKVFDISIKIDGFAKDITHNMNTTNEIITHYEPHALVVPLSYIYSTEEGNMVYKEGSEKNMASPIRYTYSNDEMALIEDGVVEGDILIMKPLED